MKIPLVDRFVDALFDEPINHPKIGLLIFGLIATMNLLMNADVTYHIILYTLKLPIQRLLKDILLLPLAWLLTLFFFRVTYRFATIGKK